MSFITADGKELRVDSRNMLIADPINCNQLPCLNLRVLEELAIKEALKIMNNDKQAAARALGVCLKTFYVKLAKYKLGNVRKKAKRGSKS